VVAAARAGLKRVLLPARNRKDFEDIPDEVRKSVQLVWLDTVDEAVAAALEPQAAEGAPPRTAASGG
jgi:ATP-dependent Lon protease